MGEGVISKIIFSQWIWIHNNGLCAEKLNGRTKSISMVEGVRSSSANS